MIRLEKDSSMGCMVCGKSLRNCTCPDVDERLASMLTSPNLAVRYCLVCGKHYARCNCEHPIWARSDQPDVPDPEFNEAQRLDEADMAA